MSCLWKSLLILRLVDDKQLHSFWETLETVNGLYKTEVIEYLKVDWQGLSDIQLATLNWGDWFNKKRVHSALGYV